MCLSKSNIIRYNNYYYALYNTSDLEQSLGEENGGIQLIRSRLHLLLFADDLVLLSESPEGLQRSLNGLAEFCNT